MAMNVSGSFSQRTRMRQKRFIQLCVRSTIQRRALKPASRLMASVRRRYPCLPVVLTSGYNAIMANEGQYGFELVVKPYTHDTLARAVGKALAGKAGQA